MAAIVDDRCHDGREAVKDALLAAVAARDAPAQDNVTVALLEGSAAPGAPAT